MLLTTRMNQERKLYLIYALNVVDWVCTLILLLSGRFYEANPISQLFIGDIYAGFLIKCALPLLIVVSAVYALELLDTKALRTTDRFISFALTFYLMIVAVHGINFLLWAIF